MSQAQGLEGVTKFLLTNSKTGCVGIRYKKYQRYVTLNCTEMFVQLVNLYTVMFKLQWQDFKIFFDDVFVVPQGVEPTTYAARVYISTWFHDLYCSIREATRAVGPLDFHEKYDQERMPHSTQYDAFLVLLTESLKPTHIQHTPEDTLYMPLLSKNPVDIADFTLNDEIFDVLINVMIENTKWKIHNVSNNKMGRPFWLFDWHDEQTCCAWFPQQGNYDSTDVALAYIVGAACTPNLGPRDADDWQFPPNGINPMKNDMAKLSRISTRSFFGSYEIHSLETDDCYNLPDSCVTLLVDSANKKRKVPKGGEDKDTVVPSFSFKRYRLVDWCYYARVIVNSDWDTRIDGLRMICMG